MSEAGKFMDQCFDHKLRKENQSELTGIDSLTAEIDKEIVESLVDKLQKQNKGRYYLTEFVKGLPEKKDLPDFKVCCDELNNYYKLPDEERCITVPKPVPMIKLDYLIDKGGIKFFEAADLVSSNSNKVNQLSDLLFGHENVLSVNIIYEAGGEYRFLKNSPGSKKFFENVLNSVSKSARDGKYPLSELKVFLNGDTEQKIQSQLGTDFLALNIDRMLMTTIKLAENNESQKVALPVKI